MLRSLAKTMVFLVCIMKAVHLYAVSTTGKCKDYVIGMRTSLVYLLFDIVMVVVQNEAFVYGPRAGRSIFLTSSSEVSSEVLFLLRSAGGSHALDL